MELLLMAFSHEHPDPIVDDQLYKRGDLVVARPDGWPWGSEEHPATARPRNFWLIKIPGLALSEGRQSALEHCEFDVHGKVVLRRRWRALIDDMPLTMRRALLDTGQVTVTYSQVRNHVRNKRTDEPL